MYTSNKGKERRNYAQGWEESLPFIRGWVLSKLVSPVHVGLCELLKFRSPRSSICFSFPFLWAVELGREVLIAVSELCCVKKKKSPSAGQIDGIINTGDWKDDQINTREERRGGKGDRLDAELWSSLYAEPLRLQPPVSLETTPPLFFFCSEKTVFASFQWWHKHCIMAALKSFLSNDTCSLAFLSNKRSFWLCFLFFFHHNNKDLYTVVQNVQSLMSSSLVNYVCAISFPWICTAAHVMPDPSGLQSLAHTKETDQVYGAPMCTHT